MGSLTGSSHAVIRESTNGGDPFCSLLTVLEAPSRGSYGLEEFGTAFAKPGGYVSKDIEMLWPAVADELADYQVPVAPQYLPRPPTPRAPVLEIDAIDAAEAPLRRLLALASVVGLPQQIEREDANIVRRPRLPSLVVTLSLLGNRAAGGESVSGSELEVHVPAGHAK